MNVVRKKIRRRCSQYNEEEREHLRAAGRFNGRVMDYLRPHVRAGITTGELNRLAHEFITGHGHRPATLGYRGFPASICTSINEVVCHGIPGPAVLREGDIVNIDVSSVVNGWYGDSSETFLIGDVSPAARELVQTTFEAMHLGIAAIQPGGRLAEIGKAIERHARARGLEIVRDYAGHGLGQEFHLDPNVPHYYPKANPPTEILLPGWCFTVEPMLNQGTWRTLTDSRDGWTVRTMDLQLSAQFEHTVLVTETGYEILTATTDGPQIGHTF